MTHEFPRKKLGSKTGGWLIAEEALLKLAGAGCRWQRLAGGTISSKLKEAVGQHLLKIPRKAEIRIQRRARHKFHKEASERAAVSLEPGERLT